MKRIPRNKRLSCAPNMALTERDKEIIIAVYENRFLRRDQIERLFFANRHSTPTTASAANRRLMRLYQHGYLDRIYKQVNFGVAQAVYALDKKGAELVAKELGIDRAKINWKRKNNKVEMLFLEHTLAINEFYVNFILSIRQRPDINLLFWKRESEELNDRVPDPEGKRKYLTVAPDAFFGIKTSKGKSYFFLEVDMGTMPLTRFKTKITAYRQYWKTGRYTQRYGFKSFRVLTVTSSNKRLANLLKTAKSCGAKSMFLFTTQKLTTNILEDIWFTSTSSNPTFLLD